MKKISFFAVLLAVLALPCMASENPEALEIGWASCDISTEKPVNLAGQWILRISKGVLDPISCTALWIGNRKDGVCFLSVDIISPRNDFSNAVFAAVKKRDPEFPLNKLIINGTHTHSAPQISPVSYQELIDCMDNVYSWRKTVAEMAEKCADAAVTAYRTRKPGGFAYGYGFAVVAHSRRTMYSRDMAEKRGTGETYVKMYGKANHPDFSGFEAGADHFINLLFTFDGKGNLTGAILNVPCPSQNTEFSDRVSASFWHETRQLIRKKYGNIFLLSQCAAAGDLAPRQLHYLKAEERRYALKYGKEEKFSEAFRRADIAERIAAAFDEVYAWAKRDIRTFAPIEHRARIIPLSRRIVTDAEAAEAQKRLAELPPPKTTGTPEEQFTANSRRLSVLKRNEGVLKKYEAQKTQPKIFMEMHALHIGDLAFATNTVEFYMDFMHRIQARSPYTQTFVIQLCGSGLAPQGVVGSYLSTVRAQANKGYGSSVYENRFAPEAGQEIVEETLKDLNGMAKK